MLKEQGKNPFILESKEPTTPYKEFLKGEIRYSQLANVFPDVAEKCLTLRKGMQENVMRLTRDWQNRNIRNR